MEQTNGIKYFSGVDSWGGVVGGAHNPLCYAYARVNCAH